MSNEKKVVVIPNGLGCKVLINPEVVPEGALVNPDTTNVRGLSPEDWRIVNGKLVSDLPLPLPPAEYTHENKIRHVIDRNAERASQSIDNLTIKLTEQREIDLKRLKKAQLIIHSLIAAVALAIVILQLQ